MQTAERELLNTKEYVNTKEAAKYLGISYFYFMQTWPSLERYGVRAFKPGGRRLLFRQDELRNYIEASAVN